MEEDKKRRRYNIHSILHPPVLGYIVYSSMQILLLFPLLEKGGKGGKREETCSIYSVQPWSNPGLVKWQPLIAMCAVLL